MTCLKHGAYMYSSRQLLVNKNQFEICFFNIHTNCVYVIYTVGLFGSVLATHTIVAYQFVYCFADNIF